MTISNKYPGKCSICSVSVGASMGHAVKGSDGKWTVRCRAHIDGAASTAATSTTSASTASARTITVQRDGRRSYLTGDTLAVRGLLRSGGCHWDGDRKAWWIGSHDEALALAERARAASAEAAPRKRITHCQGCGSALGHYAQMHSYRFCSYACGIDRAMSGQSGWVGGVWHQGSDD